MAVWVDEQAHIPFSIQYVTHCAVNLFNANNLVGNQAFQVLAVHIVGHVHIDAGLQRHGGSLTVIFGHAVFD